MFGDTNISLYLLGCYSYRLGNNVYSIETMYTSNVRMDSKPRTCLVKCSSKFIIYLLIKFDTF